jgi:hypothetical protein
MDDPLYQEAKEVAKEIGYLSVSSLQRKMRIGYTRAAQIIDDMANEGFCEMVPDITGKRKIIQCGQVYEIWCNGKLHYTRPAGHPDVQEALDLIERCNRLFGVASYEVRLTPRAADKGGAGSAHPDCGDPGCCSANEGDGVPARLCR